MGFSMVLHPSLPFSPTLLLLTHTKPCNKFVLLYFSVFNYCFLFYSWYFFFLYLVLIFLARFFLCVLSVGYSLFLIEGLPQKIYSLKKNKTACVQLATNLKL
uniref:Uncharacterized protein n=1 Tax=Cacopsylla melanoneura TaxID=428564 RepID=A0A8D8ZMJ6_9HEMI